MLKAVSNFLNKIPKSEWCFFMAASFIFNAIMCAFIIFTDHSFFKFAFFGTMFILALTEGAFFFCFGFWQSAFDYIKANPIKGTYCEKPFIVEVTEKDGV